MFAKYSAATVLAIASLAGFVAANSGSCTAARPVVNSVPYCNEVQHIRYKNVVSPGGSYELVTHMDPDTCACEKSVGTFSGALAPLDEDMSLHFRGPLVLKQVGVYYPGGASKRSALPPYGHGRQESEEEYENSTQPELYTRSVGSLDRVAYYNAEQGIADGLIFFNNHGGDGSGTFDHCWGSSLSFANSNMDGGASSPQVLKDITIPSNVEFTILSDQECDSSCGYTRPGAPAYKGFAGKNKVFLFEFSMPHQGGSGGFNSDMPSIWGLNAKIPRTSQYSGCSCWGTGCGEFDFFEVLEGDKDRVKSHFHADPKTQAGGGSPDFFKRPTDKLIKAAAIFDPNGEVHIRVLDDNVTIGPSLDINALGVDDKDASVYEVPR